MGPFFVVNLSEKIEGKLTPPNACKPEGVITRLSQSPNLPVSKKAVSKITMNQRKKDSPTQKDAVRLLGLFCMVRRPSWCIIKRNLLKKQSLVCVKKKAK